ncbi:MAG: hypothetical protein R3C61_11890 [Bacteroidia bacterium]
MDIEKILREKPFSSLTEREREVVLAEMSAQEYESLRDTARAAERYFRDEAKTLTPRAEIQGNIRELMRKKQDATLTGRISRLVQLRIPAYQVAAALALLFGTIYFSEKTTQSLYPSGTHKIIAADSTLTDSATEKGVNLPEDTVFSRFMMETL